MDTLIWRILFYLNIYFIGGFCYSQGTLLKLLKRIDSKLDEIKTEENELYYKRFAYPPLPDTSLDNFNYKPKWYARYRHFSRPRIKFPPLPDKRDFSENTEDTSKDNVLKDNEPSLEINSIPPQRETFNSNSITSLYSNQLISDKDNLETHIRDKDLNLQRTKELEDTLDYVSKQVNRMLQDKSINSGAQDLNLDSKLVENWMENEIPDRSEGRDDFDAIPDLIADLSDFSYKLNQSLRATESEENHQDKNDVPQNTEEVDPFVSLISKLTKRIDTLTRALPPVPLKQSETERALPPLPDRAFPPLPYRAFPPLPHRAFPPLPDRAFPPLPNRAFPPLPDRAFPPLPDRAFPPLPQRAFPPLPHRALPPLPDRAFPPLPLKSTKALPPLPKLSAEKRQKLVSHISELSQQIKSLSDFLDNKEEHRPSEPVESGAIPFSDRTDRKDERESDQPIQEKLVHSVINLSNEVQRLLLNYRRNTGATYRLSGESNNQDTIMPEDTQYKSLSTRSVSWTSSLDGHEDQDSLETDLQNLPSRKTDGNGNSTDQPEPLQRIVSGIPLQSQNDLNGSEVSNYIQRVNEEVDQILQGRGPGLQPSDFNLNTIRSGQDPCKGVAILKQREGNIDYPSGHGEYSSFQDCRWVIMGSGNQQVRIRFTMMSIEKDNPCDDYVQVSQVDASRITTPKKVYTRLCEKSVSNVPASKKEFVVNGPNALIHFHSDWIWTARGFSLRYRIEDTKPSKPKPGQPTPAPKPMPDACKGSGVTVRGAKGTIDFFTGYPDKARCRWFINGGKGAVGIKVTVKAIDIESSKDCKKDKLIIASVNLKKKTFKAVKELCGSSPPSSAIEVLTNDAYVVLTSDAQRQGRGFRLTFEQIQDLEPPPYKPPPPPTPAPFPTAIPPMPNSPYNEPCKEGGSIVRGDKGVIDFKAPYKNNANCSWFIVAAENAHQIWLTVTYVDIKGTGKKCEGDRLLVAALLMNQNKVAPVDVICGSKPRTQKIIVPSRYVYLGFRSDGSLTGNGFKLSYSAEFPELPPMTTTLAPGATPKPKPVTPVPAQPSLVGLSCTFESGTSCKWGNLKTSSDPLEWKIQSAGSNGWRSFAKQDHTTGSSRGSYAYLNANEANAGSKGTLKSPTIKAATGDGMCLTLWYNMFDTFGRFTVDMIPQGETEETLFVLDGNQGNVWHQAKVALISDIPFQVYLTHTRGDKATETGLAIDDVQVKNSPCLATPLACGQTKYHPRSKRDLTSGHFERSLNDLERDVGDLENFVRDNEDKNLTKRVMSGEASRHGEWPWIVHLRNFHYGISAGVYSQCGGTLIHPKWILSAAHCFEGDGGEVKKDPNNVMLYFGEHNIGYGSIEEAQFAVKPAKVILHPNRNKKAGGSAAHRFDFALIELKAPVTRSDFINVACLPDGPTPVGSKCVAAGWGVTDTGDTSIRLLHIAQQVINRRLCMYRTFEDQVCAITVKGYGDVCQGDSGGPLMCKRSDGKYEVIGAVSFGDKCAKKERTPGVYANVHHAMSWIQTTMGNTD